MRGEGFEVREVLCLVLIYRANGRVGVWILVACLEFFLLLRS